MGFCAGGRASRSESRVSPEESSVFALEAGDSPLKARSAALKKSAFPVSKTRSRFFLHGITDLLARKLSKDRD
jgi:hypothetical protein